LNETIFLALGTNLGNRVENLRSALEALTKGVDILAVSPVYETPPWGYTDQPAFLNMVLQAQTHLSPEDLLLELKRLEVELGRQPNFRYGPRLIDLDILFYGDRVVSLDNLAIPHPRLHERAFVLVPLADLAPDLFHPLLGKTIRELLSAVNREGIHIFEAVVCAPCIEHSVLSDEMAVIRLPSFSQQVLGTGCVPIHANLNGQILHTPVLSDNNTNQYLIINSTALTAGCLKRGQVIAASLVPDREPRSLEIPADLAAALAAAPEALAAFNRLALSHRREFVQWIEEAKRSETRARRIAETLKKVLA